MKAPTVESADLSAYRLTKPLAALFAKFDRVAAALAAVGRPATCVRIYADDYRALADLVQGQSARRYDITRVRYRGLPIERYEP